MNAAAWCFAVAFGIALVIHFIIRGELDRLYAEVNHLARDLRDARRQRDLADAERDDLDAVLRMLLAERPSAQVLPFGPVQSGVVKRIPGQRNGEGA